MTCTAFIVSSVYEKIVDYYFVVLLKKIFLALQVPVVLLLYMTSLHSSMQTNPLQSRILADASTVGVQIHHTGLWELPNPEI